MKKYFMPPEWAPHRLTLLAWPDNRETWPGDRLNRVEQVYANILQALVPYEEVVILTSCPEAHQAASAMIQNRGLDWNRIRLLRVPVNDVWIRDYGPVTLFEKQEPADTSATPATSGGNQKVTWKPVMANWGYNAWGGKYPPWDDDDRVPEQLAGLLGYPFIEPGMILEGGSIDVNGAGTLLTTESVLLNPNRNPALNRQQIEEKLRNWLGVDQIIWLKKGLRGDDTDGHIDDLARFVSKDTIMATVCHDRADPNYDLLQENLEILYRAHDLDGQPFKILELPLPATRIDGTTVDGSDYVPASYANFYIANGCVLVPTYDQRYDEQVLNLFRPLFQGRRIIGIPCKNLVWGQGSIHCITCQVPQTIPQKILFEGYIS